MSNISLVKRVMNSIGWRLYTQQVYKRWQTWDRLGGGKHAEKQIKPFELLSRPSFNPVPLNDPIFQDLHYRRGLREHKQRRFTEYVYHIRNPCYIEPEFGYVIMEPSVLVPESLAWSHVSRTKGKLNYFSGVPSFKDYKEARQGKRAIRKEDVVISLQHVFDNVYGHCLIQLMPVLLLLDECGIPSHIPIVVSAKLGQLPFFQEMIQRGGLRNRRWIVQDERYIYASEVIFASTEWPSPSLLNRFLDILEAPRSDERSKRRLFILRKTRQLANMDLLVPILNDYKFDQIRPEELTFAQQIELFSQAGFVCGVLGSALTNTIFRREARLQILEISSSSDSDLFFYGLANTCGFSHRTLVGTNYERGRHTNFSIDPEQFRMFLSNSFANS